MPVQQVRRVEVIDTQSDKMWDYTEVGLSAARMAVCCFPRYRVMVNGSWDTHKVLWDRY